jgi:hypothetical protein
MYRPPASAFEAFSPLEPQRAAKRAGAWSIARDFIVTILVMALTATGAVAIRFATFWN